MQVQQVVGDFPLAAGVAGFVAVPASVGSAFWGMVAGVFALLVQQWRPGGFRQ